MSGRVAGKVAFITALVEKANVQNIINARRGGSIVLTSSVGGKKPYPNVGNYVSAKDGVVGSMLFWRLTRAGTSLGLPVDAGSVLK